MVTLYPKHTNYASRVIDLDLWRNPKGTHWKLQRTKERRLTYFYPHIIFIMENKIRTEIISYVQKFKYTKV